MRPSLPRYRRMAQALAEVDPGNTTRPRLPADPQTSYTYTKTTPAPAPASFTQSQHWLDEDAYDHYGGDDEQEYDPDDTECDRSATPPPAQHPPNHQVPPHQRQPQPQVQPQATPAPSPFVAVATAAAAAAAAHVHFHSRVRITSGLRRSGGTTHALGDSSDSDSPSSSISAPLRFRSRDAMPRAPLTERVSRLATQALQRRRAVIAAARTSSSSSAVPRLRARDCGEYAPLIGAGGPVTYGAARCGISVTGNRHRANGVRDQLRGEDDCAFGEWPWRALNRHVSDLLLLVQGFIMINFSGGGGRSNQRCVAAVLMSQRANDRNLHCRFVLYSQQSGQESPPCSHPSHITQVVILYYTDVFVYFH